MKYIPKIVLVENTILEESNLFLRFLHHPYYIQNRALILTAFPQLKQLLKTSGTELSAVRLFINKFYQENRITIDKIIKRNTKILNQYGSSALSTLLNITEYQYNKPIIFKAIPTILPLSPFKNNIFYFSILNEIKHRANKNAVIIGMHEISHFIVLDLLKQLEDKTNSMLHEDAKNYLKEALAVIILNQQPLRNILKLKNYKGNPELQFLTIQKTDGNIISFIDFLQESYDNLITKQHKTFRFFLEYLLNIALSITPSLIEKRKLWNQYGKCIFANSTLSQLYGKPIKIKGDKSLTFIASSTRRS